MSVGVVDLFSGGGGASAGFAAHPRFHVVGAVDAQRGKPSTPAGGLDCNATYAANIGVAPLSADLAVASPDDVAAALGLADSPRVLVACPPCTGFSRTLATNHLRDDPRNSLVRRVGEFAAAWLPDVIVMENARELVMGRFRAHLAALEEHLVALGYRVSSRVHSLDRFGLAQRRERAVVVAARKRLPLLDLEDLWRGHAVRPEATHVRRAIGHLPALNNGGRNAADPVHACPRIVDRVAWQRTRAIPQNGGSWFDLAENPELLTPTMRDRLRRGDLGSHPDVYGRMHWDRPAPTIKRECAHVGNGRYTHPEQDRLCSVRELALLNGFPADYRFSGSLSNMYRHVGDAVPPLISHQLAGLVAWLLGDARPRLADLVLPGTNLRADDILRTERSGSKRPCSR